MPELPEAERARMQIERALHREIVAVDDRDTYVSRPHAPGHRTRGGRCPRCGAEVERATIGGRTTFWCPRCQA